MRRLASFLVMVAVAGSLGYAHAQEDTIVVLTTPQGKLAIEFFPQDAPNHVSNFLDMAENMYDSTLFHRIIPGFMIQGGDPNTSINADLPPSEWGKGGPPHTLDAEFNDIMHNRGIVSMARASDPDSAGSQFFIVHQDSNFLDGQYTVFGRLATQDSYDTLDNIASVPTDSSDRPVEPDSVRMISVEILTRSQAEDAGLDLLDQGPPARAGEPAQPLQRDNMFTDETLNFSIAFPPGWVVQRGLGEESPDVVAVSPLTGALPSAMSIYVDNATGNTLDTVIQSKVENLEQLEAQGGSFQILNQERVTVNEQEVFILDASDMFESPTGPVDIKYREVTLVFPDTIYTFLLSSEAANFDSDLALFQASLESLVILSVPPPAGGGCLIATAAYGSEMAPQIQQLRELRDHSLMKTAAGSGFVEWFNSIYYSFSPGVADYERENPVFRDAVRLLITPMVHTLSLLNHIDMETEAQVVLYGSAAILAVGFTYLGIPLISLGILLEGGRRPKSNPPAKAYPR